MPPPSLIFNLNLHEDIPIDGSLIWNGKLTIMTNDVRRMLGSEGGRGLAGGLPSISSGGGRSRI